MSHAASLTKYNYQFDEGPKGPRLSWDYTSETSKCDTALPPTSMIPVVSNTGAECRLNYEMITAVRGPMVMYVRQEKSGILDLAGSFIGVDRIVFSLFIR